ncbi:MAG: hypothetical protein WC895_04125 [Candidatus Shapirobacteria bacterium]|jgi:hypothetical protein
MAATTLSVVTCTKDGTAVVAGNTLASGDTLTISCTTAQSAIDFSTLMLRFAATTTMSMIVAAGTNYSEVGQGNLTITVATGTSIVGGKDFESARFLNSTTGTIGITLSAGGGTVEAYQMPNPLTE